jgi:hypothetical protein
VHHRLSRTLAVPVGAYHDGHHISRDNSLVSCKHLVQDASLTKQLIWAARSVPAEFLGAAKPAVEYKSGEIESPPAESSV